MGYEADVGALRSNDSVGICIQLHRRRGVFYQRGDLRGMPKWCITVGMKQILASRRIYIALNRPWQHGIFKHVLFDKIQPQIPATLLQKHRKVTFCAYSEVVEGI